MSPLSIATRSASQDVHQLVVADRVARRRSDASQVDHHRRAPARRARPGSRCRARPPSSAGRSAPRRRGRVLGGADDSPRRRESRCRTPPPPRRRRRRRSGADVREAVPLRRVLQVFISSRSSHTTSVSASSSIAYDQQKLIDRRCAVAQRRTSAPADAARVERLPPGYVERQAQAEGLSRSFTSAMPCSTLSRVDQVHAAALVVGAELAPVGCRAGACFQRCAMKFAGASGGGRLARQHFERVVRCGNAHVHVGIAGHAADVRAQDEAFSPWKGCAAVIGSTAKLSRPALRDLARTHGGEQRGLVDQTAARGVDQDHAALASWPASSH